MIIRRTRFRIWSALLGAGAILVGTSAVAETRAEAPAGTSPEASIANLGEMSEPGRASSLASRPNIVVITTDDMRADDLAYMPRTRRLLGQLRLSQFVSNHPLCCPARAELLTGQLGQHNGVRHNFGREWGGYPALRAKNNTFARWFRDAGYATALVGKFTNGWCPSGEERPDGWTDFTPLVRRAYSAFDYFYYDHARVHRAPQGVHTNDFVTRRTLARMNAYEARDRTPFLIWSSFVAPHDMTRADGSFGPPVPALRHRGTLAGVVPLSQSKPSYREPNARQQARAFNEDAGTCAGEPGPQSAGEATVRRSATITVRRLNQLRLESLQSVDEGVGRMVRQLRRLGELSRTVVVFTSDNGYLLGEHGLLGKNSYYEESLRVPLLAIGPGVASGESAKDSMITDISPSLARLARVDVQRVVDGRRDLFAAGGGWDGLLIQAGSIDAPWLWRGVRTRRWTYVDLLDGNVRLYDRETDPYQLQNLAGQGLPVEDLLRDALEVLKR